MRYSPAVLDPGARSTLRGRVGCGRSQRRHRRAGSLESGTLIRMQVLIDGDLVVDAKFKAFGCSAAIASASFVAERVQGLTVGRCRR